MGKIIGTVTPEQPVVVGPQPWECPRCGTINAPHASQCSCRPGRRPERWTWDDPMTWLPPTVWPLPDGTSPNS